MSKRRQPTAPQSAKSRKAILRGLVLFLFFLGLNIYFENRDLIDFGSSSCDTVHADTTPPFYEGTYPLLTRLMLGNTPSNRVAIVSIPSGAGEVQDDLCEGRSYLAALITVLTTNALHPGSGPSAIVIDKYFSSSACGGVVGGQPRDQRTGSLVKAVQAVRELKVPVIVGESTTLNQHGGGGSCLVENPDQLDFGQNVVQRGLLRLNANKEQIPLHWQVLRSHAVGAASDPKPSLSLVAASNTPGSARVTDLQSGDRGERQPYARLDLELPTAKAQDLVCAKQDPDAQKHWDCPSFPSGRTPPVLDQNGDPFDWNGKVVVIGSQNEVDHWAVLGKRRWGYELQAEYLDALLSRQYLRALSGRLIFALSVLFVFLLEFVPARGDYLFSEKGKRTIPGSLRRPELWDFCWPLVFCALVTALSLASHYLPPLSVVSGALLTMAARVLFNGMEHFRKQTVPHHQEPKS